MYRQSPCLLFCGDTRTHRFLQQLYNSHLDQFYVAGMMKSLLKSQSIPHSIGLTTGLWRSWMTPLSSWLDWMMTWGCPYLLASLPPFAIINWFLIKILRLDLKQRGLLNGSIPHSNISPTSHLCGCTITRRGFSQACSSPPGKRSLKAHYGTVPD